MSSYHFDRLKVLIVDDNPHMRRLVSTILKAFGIKMVFEAANGEDAWEMLLSNPCDIVFVDWVMDGMSGLELSEKVRTSPNSPNAFVPIVMLTGHTSIEHVHRARDAGVNEFLAKPVSPKTILSRVSSVIEQPRPFVRTKNYFGPCRRRRRADTYDGPERRDSESKTVEPGRASANAA
jgi:two-component system chemotaxis response regulator CheY